MVTPATVQELQRGSTHHPGAALLPKPTVTPGIVAAPSAGAAPR